LLVYAEAEETVELKTYSTKQQNTPIEKINAALFALRMNQLRMKVAANMTR
jgi:ribosomal protein L29